jgi:putative oxidoreductase
MGIQLNATFLLRIAVSVILIMHSIPGMFNNGVNDFGNLYLNAIGFAPFGVAIAWAIKISHVLAALCFLLEKYVKIAGIITLLILVMGIVMVHWPEGWYVVGGGRNGIEFNFLLIAAIVTIMFPKGIFK